MLTFIVGSTIVLTLIGRGELIGKIGGLPSPAERARNLQGGMQDRFKAEEQARRLKLIASGEATDKEQESLEDESEEADESDEESDDKKDDKKDSKSEAEKKKEDADSKEKDKAKIEKEE